MVDQLSSFADEVTRVAREVGTEGRLGGQAEVKGVSGTWRDLTENVNFLASNLTDQVRNIAQVTTAVANGDLSKKIDVDAQGEIAELKDTINTMVDQLNSFAAEVTRVALEVGTRGKLGGQATVEGASGTWRDLTQNVNQLAGNLTTQVRAIAEVSTAVTQGDLTRRVTVDAQGEVAELSDTINQMIANLRETTQKNAEQDWLNMNLARISGLMQGQRDLATVSRMIMSEISPLVTAQHGAFFLTESDNTRSPEGSQGTGGSEPELRLIASYGYKHRKTVSNRFKIGEGLVGQAALEGKSILITNAPPDYVKVTSGLGEAQPKNIIVMPILFEEQVMAVVELASLREFSDVNQAFLEQLAETLGVVLNAIIANRRTEELLEQSQSLAEELQSQSEELQSQQEELRRSNSELEQQTQSLRASEELLQTQQEELQQTNEELQEKAELLSVQNRGIEIQNAAIEKARADLEGQAAQLALSSKYKSEFLANMSHELRTPLNSLLILSKLLAENPEENLTAKQIEFASTIHTAGADLLSLISDILDLSKVEAGKMDVRPTAVVLDEVREYVWNNFGPLAEQQGLDLIGHAVVDLHRRAAPAAGPAQPAVQRLQVHRHGPRRARGRGGGGGHAVRAEHHGSRHGHRHRGGQAAAHLRGLPAGRRDDEPALRRDRPRAVDQPRDRPCPGRRDPRPEHPGRGQRVHPAAGRVRGPARAGAGRSGERGCDGERRRPRPRPRRAAAPAPGDRAGRGRAARAGVALIIDDDAAAAVRALVQAREHGFRAVVSRRGTTGVTLAHDLTPDVVVLAVPVRGGATVLEQLKHHPRTRHIPVYVCGATEERIAALRAGAAGFLARPVEAEALAQAYTEAGAFIDRPARRLLVVEDNEVQRESIVALVGAGDDVEVIAVGSTEEAQKALEGAKFDCIVLDLKLPKTTGFALLDHLKGDPVHNATPVIIHTGKELTRREETRLRRYADSIIVKDAGSPERLLDETALFLHRSQSALPPDSRRMLEQLHTADAVLPGKRVMIVDDDVRNVFALTSALEARGMEVRFAENGREAIESLDADPAVDLVLMDVMMPEMDGHETTVALRADDRFADLPIISLTAKAMKGDREKSIAAGASDYITKPVDIEQLISLMRVWLYG
jgi:CheY-like chemotaxis protein/signal transduction histidine kinase/HAMP domain-containing protein